MVSVPGVVSRREEDQRAIAAGKERWKTGKCLENEVGRVAAYFYTAADSPRGEITGEFRFFLATAIANLALQRIVSRWDGNQGSG